MWRVRIDDRAVLHLIRTWWKAGSLDTEGPVLHPETGTPQGGTVSPVLATVYVHEALALGFDQVVKAHGRGEARLCRDADDGVGACRDADDAARFSRVLPQRWAKFRLHIAPEKTHRRRFSRFHPGLPRRFTCLGCEVAWMPDRQGVSRVMRRTARRTLQAACRRLAEWIKQPRPLPGRDFFQRLNARLRGHDQYDGVRGHSRSLHRFFPWAMAWTLTWRNRRGGQRPRVAWEPCTRLLARLQIARPSSTEVSRRRVSA
jgi:hypothetical protein